MRAFFGRNWKELVRDPLSVLLGLGFPVVLLLMMQFLRASIQSMPPELFAVEIFAPGMAVFGLSFLTLFLAQLMATDRTGAFLMRLRATPLRSFDYLLGYALPMFPLAAVQGAVCLGLACAFGLPLSWRLLPAVAVTAVVAALYISIGLLLGALLQPQQVGGVGTILINVSMWLSGVWFSLDMIGGAFQTVCELLPFSHAVLAVACVLSGEPVLPHLLWVLGYTLVFALCAIWRFGKRLRV